MRGLIPHYDPGLGVLLGLPLVVLAFVGVVAWVYSKKRRDLYEDASRLPLEDENGS